MFPACIEAGSASAGRLAVLLLSTKAASGLLEILVNYIVLLLVFMPIESVHIWEPHQAYKLIHMFQ